MWQIKNDKAKFWENLMLLLQECLLHYLIHARHCDGCWEITGEKDPLTLQLRKEDILFYRYNTVAYEDHRANIRDFVSTSQDLLTTWRDFRQVFTKDMMFKLNLKKN